MRELWDRFHAPTPIFWKKVRTKMLIMSASLAGLGAGLMNVSDLPEWVNLFAEYSIKIGAVAPLLVAFMASLTVDNSEGK